MFLDDNETEVATGTLPPKLPPSLRGKPIFQCFLEQAASGTKRLSEVFPSIVFADEQCVAFVPAGFRGNPETDTKAFGKYRARVAEDSADSSAAQQQLVNSISLTPLGLNPTSFHHGGGATLMSLVHVLVIPRRRIYNAVTLTPDDVPLLRHLQTVGAAAVRALLRADGRDANGLAAALETVPSTLAELAAAPYLPGALHLGEVAAHQLGGTGHINAPETTFHVHPQATIGYLHLHATCPKLRTAAYSHMDEKARGKEIGGSAGFPKNILAEDIIAALLGGRAPPIIPVAPVSVFDVMRANEAAIVIQQQYRRRRLQRSQSGLSEAS